MGRFCRAFIIEGFGLWESYHTYSHIFEVGVRTLKLPWVVEEFCDGVWHMGSCLVVLIGEENIAIIYGFRR